MPHPERDVQINISGIPVAGIGGLGLVAIAVLVSVVMPAAWWTMVAGLCGGIVLAVALIAYRRRRPVHGPSGTDPTILFRVEPTAPESPASAASRLDPRYSTV